MLLHLRFLQALHTLRPASLSKVQWAQHHGWLGEWCIDVDQQMRAGDSFFLTLPVS